MFGRTIGLTKEAIMSGRNGDKARSDRERKKKNLRRKRTLELRKKLSLQNKEAQAAGAKAK
jgi:hypothetical protein